MLKTIKNTFTGQTFKMGRRRPVAPCPRLSLKNYLQRSFPAIPLSIDYSAKAKRVLANIYGNDTLGDCVIAGMGHITGVITGNAGMELELTQQQIIDLYGAIGGYVPGDPNSDQGCDEQTALNYWVNKGKNGIHKITGWMAVNAADPLEVRAALWLFENLIFGVELPDKWVNPMPDRPGFTWDVAGPADPDNGHCFIGCGYDAKTVTIDTWGMLGSITNAATAQYAAGSDGGELYTVLSPDSIIRATAKAPNGFDWSQLVADFDSMLRSPWSIHAKA